MAASSASSDGFGTLAISAGIPILVMWLRPYRPAAAGKSDAARCWVARPMNAVLHETVNACWSVEADSSGAALWNVSPSTVIVGGQLAGESGVRPLRISAVEVSTLNVDPGGYWPCSAPSNS